MPSPSPDLVGHNSAQAVKDLRRAAFETGPAVLASSMSAEDMVLIDLINTAGLDIEIFMLDTGRLNDETHALVSKTVARYGRQVEIFEPAPEAVRQYVGDNGEDAFYRTVALRQRCCEIRKLEPLRRALEGKGAWITGQRRQQSVTRVTLETEEWDAANGLAKFNPLAHWTRSDVWSYIETHGVPYNELHNQGYASIGCAPCTRPITVGEDERAGRWWWENAETKECGLHAAPGTHLPSQDTLLTDSSS